MNCPRYDDMEGLSRCTIDDGPCDYNGDGNACDYSPDYMTEEDLDDLDDFAHSPVSLDEEKI